MSTEVYKYKHTGIGNVKVYKYINKISNVCMFGFYNISNFPMSSSFLNKISKAPNPVVMLLSGGSLTRSNDHFFTCITV